jgi:hypothetical protein
MNANNSSTMLNAERKTRLQYLRGAGFALLFGIIGFAAPIFMVVVFTVLGWLINGTREFDRNYDMRRLSETLIFPAVGTAWVFAGTGWAVFAPHRKHRFLRALLVITFTSIPFWYLLAFLGMSPRRYKGMEHPLIFPSEILLFAIPPLIIAFVLSMRRDKRCTDANDAEESRNRVSAQSDITINIAKTVEPS